VSPPLPPPPPARFAPSLEPSERAVIEEELHILETVRAHLASLLPEGTRTHYTPEMLELRDALGEAHTEDVPQLIALMESLAMLATHHEANRSASPVRPASPYFGHIRIEQEDKVRDVLIGSTSVLGGKLKYPIVDWRQSPISKLYYSYREGEGYDEELGGKPVSGEILTHRSVTIRHGELMGIRWAGGELACDGGTWRKTTYAPPVLHGGEGRAVRAETVEALHLGVGEAKDRRLSEITALIDPAQFEVITRPDSGIVVVDGGAGSGKTTIALHRMAYLAARNPLRFRPEAMLAVVFNRALARYISRLMPALGVEGVRIEVFEELAARLRQRHYSSFVVGYCESTPYAVIRFKQHPAALALLEETAQALEAEIRTEVTAAVEGTDSAERVRTAWEELGGLPLAVRVERMVRWAAGTAPLPGVGAFGKDWVAQRRVAHVLSEYLPDPNRPATIPLAVWEEAFLNRGRIEEAARRHAPGEFSAGQIEEIATWGLRGYQQRETYREWQEERRQGADGSGEGEAEEKPLPPELDREDDTLLLTLYRQLVGPLRSRRQRPLRYGHLTVDEAQDFGPLDLDWLISLAEEPRSVTLAGDTAQRMILHNAFDTWEDVLASLGLEGTAVSPLAVGYRSTAEIMEFANHVLGPLQPDRAWSATRRGVPVELLSFTDAGQAVGVLGDALHELLRQEPHAYVAVIARHTEQAQVIYEGLARSEVPWLRRVADQDFAFQPGIEVTDVSQVKGLEFDYVVLLDVDAATYPDDTASRYALHIAATRAAHQLWLIACGEPSPLLPPALITGLD